MMSFRLVNNVEVSVEHSSFIYAKKNIPEDLNLHQPCCYNLQSFKQTLLYSEFKSLLDPILNHFWRVRISPTFTKCFCNSSS
jgi:hypothetical protein